MKRDVSLVRLNELESLVIAADNSGGIGLKEKDFLKTPYDVVSYYGFRVAVMECMAAGGKPISVVVHNFCQDDAWEPIMIGIERGMKELGMKNIPITGSTESNFTLLQSALGVIVIGKRAVTYREQVVSPRDMELAVIGSPLVGHEVLDCAKDVLPLSLFYELCQLEDIVILPIGSKGIMHEVRNILDDDTIISERLKCDVDIGKTAGPSTCVLMAFKPELESLLVQKCGHLYHSVEWC